MWFRAVFSLITAFWLLMTFLLIRQEFGGKSRVDSGVGLEVVWEKMLTAPDSSSLTIYHKREKIGFCRWTAAVLEQVDPSAREDQLASEGRVKRIAGYQVDFEGGIFLGEETNRLRFDLRMVFSTNNSWQTIDLTAGMKPDMWQLRGNASEDAVSFTQRSGEEQWEQQFKLSDLQNPQKLLRNNPVAWASLNAMGLDQWTRSTNLARAVQWESRTDTLQLGSSRARVYRLETKGFEGLKAIIYVSRAGEILRAELPGGYLLVNESIADLEEQSE